MIEPTELMRRHATFVVRHARAIVSVSLLVTAISGAGIGRLHVRLDPEEQRQRPGIPGSPPK